MCLCMCIEMCNRQCVLDIDMCIRHVPQTVPELAVPRSLTRHRWIWTWWLRPCHRPHLCAAPRALLPQTYGWTRVGTIVLACTFDRNIDMVVDRYGDMCVDVHSDRCRLVYACHFLSMHSSAQACSGHVRKLLSRLV